MTNNQNSSMYAVDREEDGWLCLDFANTLSWRGSEHPKEHINSYVDLVSWSQRARVLADDKASNLIKMADRRPSKAEDVFDRAIKLREAIYHVFSAIIIRTAANSSDLEILNMELSKAMAKMQIAPIGGHYALVLSLDERSLDCVLWSIARSLADLFASNKLDRVRKCAAKECGWLFLDKSRNRSRRWCDMKDCGNRAKARRHYRRKHEGKVLSP